MSAGAGHDSEALAAAYLGGEPVPGGHEAFEAHLVDCEACWAEVRDGREGRRLAEQARSVAPAALREQLRARILQAGLADAVLADAVPAGALQPRSRRARRALVAAVAAAALVLVGGGVLVATRAPAQPGQIAAAVEGFRARRLPGTLVPADQAPDLRGLGLRAVGAAAGPVAGRTVTAYAYRDDAGRDLVLYLSAEPFPTARGATLLRGPDGPWVATTGGVTVLCARSPHALLVLSRDRELVMATAAAMRLT